MGWQRAFALLTILFVIQATITADCAYGLTHYVSKTGSNTPPFTSWTSAATQVSLAAYWSSPIDTILVGAGTFLESDSIAMSFGGTLMGIDRDSSTIVMQSNLYHLVYCLRGNLEVKNLTVESEAGKDFENAILHAHTEYDLPDTLRVDSCTFRYFFTAITSFARRPEILRNTFEECGHRGGTVCHIDWGSGNSLVAGNLFASLQYDDFGEPTFVSLDMNWNADSAIVRDNVFRGDYMAVGNYALPGLLRVENNQFLDNSIDKLGSGTEYIFSNGSTVKITNNLFRSDCPVQSGGWQIRVAYYDEVTIENNMFLGTLTGIGYDTLTGGQGATVLIRNNSFFLSDSRPNIVKLISNTEIDSTFCTDWIEYTPALVTIITDNFCNSPMLVDSTTYHLQLHSPAIDAGVADILDVDGTRSDIGAWGGPHGAAYAYVDLAPSTPQNVTGTVTDHRFVVSFTKNHESDLEYYSIFRFSELPAVLDPAHLLSYLAGDIVDSYLDSTRITFIDTTTYNEQGYYYVILAVDNAAIASAPTIPVWIGLTDVDDSPAPLPDGFVLHQNYPNPFNATTEIVYNLPNIGAQPAPVRLVIYNILGQEVRTIVDESQSPGRHVVYWNGKDRTGNDAASGIYLYSLQVSGIDFVKHRRMVLVK